MPTQKSRRQSLETRRISEFKLYHGVTPDEYDAMFQSQRGACNMCSTLWTNGKRRFPVGRDPKTGASLGILCIQCNSTHGTSRPRKRTPEQIRDADMRRLYGITVEDYDAMFDKQGGACKICRTPWIEGMKRFPVDHDHRTNAVRGILCDSCNRAIGLMNDDPARLMSAASYIESFTQQLNPVREESEFCHASDV